MKTTYRNFILDPQQRFIFAYVPKVACTNWKCLMRYMAGLDDWLNAGLAHDKQNGGLRYLDLSSPDRYFLEDPGIPKYAMVRNPYSRTLSAYLNKIESRIPNLENTESTDPFDRMTRSVDNYRKNKLDTDKHPTVDYYSFLSWMENSPDPNTKNEHWAPQTDLLLHPDVKFDFLGRFENLAEDSERILSAMECSQRFPSQKEVRFAPTGAVDKLQKYYGPDEQESVARLLKNDLDAYGYGNPLKGDREQNIEA